MRSRTKPPVGRTTTGLKKVRRPEQLKIHSSVKIRSFSSFFSCMIIRASLLSFFSCSFFAPFCKKWKRKMHESLDSILARSSKSFCIGTNYGQHGLRKNFDEVVLALDGPRQVGDIVQSGKGIGPLCWFLDAIEQCPFLCWLLIVSFLFRLAQSKWWHHREERNKQIPYRIGELIRSSLYVVKAQRYNLKFIFRHTLHFLRVGRCTSIQDTLM